VRIALHPEADEEFSAQVDFYEHRESGLGQRFYRHVFDSLAWISENPSIPRERQNIHRVNLTAFPFYIVYMIFNDDLISRAEADALDIGKIDWAKLLPCDYGQNKAAPQGSVFTPRDKRTGRCRFRRP
jgi:hypothetical protein